MGEVNANELEQGVSLGLGRVISIWVVEQVLHTKYDLKMC